MASVAERNQRVEDWRRESKDSDVRQVHGAGNGMAFMASANGRAQGGWEEQGL
jgi:hypothetical protein